ncbi:hypothetical protein D9M73_227130 [compost metagenome]
MLAQALEGFDGFLQRVLATPVQQVQVDAVAAQACEAALAGGRHAAPAGIVRVDLADQKHLVAAPGNGLANDFFRTAFGIHLGGVDQCQAQLDTLLQRRHFAAALARVFAHVPGTLADGWNVLAGKLHCTHVISWGRACSCSTSSSA